MIQSRHCQIWGWLYRASSPRPYQSLYARRPSSGVPGARRIEGWRAVDRRPFRKRLEIDPRGSPPILAGPAVGLRGQGRLAVAAGRFSRGKRLAIPLQDERWPGKRRSDSWTSPGCSGELERLVELAVSKPSDGAGRRVWARSGAVAPWLIQARRMPDFVIAERHAFARRRHAVVTLRASGHALDQQALVAEARFDGRATLPPRLIRAAVSSRRLAFCRTAPWQL